ncbi:MAG TPA: hypothetical protein DCE44_07345 [Verrucomicrobiales bacterium]|nr:hypothetical protein [Verrucomicrobiales bacterium]
MISNVELLHTPMKEYEVVRVVAIRDGRFSSQQPEFLRHPQVGDVGTIVMDHGTAFEVECCERGTGVTIWLSAMFPDELQPA